MNLFKLCIFFLFTSLVYHHNALAFEVDNFNQRSQLESLADGLPLLNAKTNELMLKAVNSYNDYKKTISCKEEFKSAEKSWILDYVGDALDGNPVGEMEDWAVAENAFPKVKPLDKDIYTGSSFFSGVVRSVAGLEPSTKVSNHVMGIDKLGHFMGQGYDYYIMAKERSNYPLSILKHGAESEEEYYGILTTGIKSYGDLAANFSGYKFWANVIEGDNPYIGCDENTGKAFVKRNFNWGDYVNSSWDEAVNCSFLEGSSLKKKFEKNIKKINLTCPISKEKCEEIVGLDCAEYYVSESCLKLFPNRKKTCSLETVGSSQKKPLNSPPCRREGVPEILNAGDEKMLQNIIEVIPRDHK